MPAAETVQRTPTSVPAAWYGWTAAALVLVGALRIVATYDDLSETVDEVAHIGAGMEWLALGRYTFELQHPPLARIAAATGPYLLGIRAQHQPNLWAEGRHVLYADGAYLRNLIAARLGVLPFFAVAAFFVWRIGRDAFGPAIALGAVACFTLLPPVLAHYGLATTDGPLVAMFAATVYALLRWFRAPTVVNGLGLGVAAGLALVTKFSAVPYLGLLAALIAAASLWAARARGAVERGQARSRVPSTLGSAAIARDRTGTRTEWTWRRTGASLAVAAGIAFLIAWAAYRFSIGPVLGVSVPAPEIPKGIGEVAEHNRYGHPAYFLGEVRSRGVWYFFPVIVALKTPLAALALGVVGFVVLAREARRTSSWVPLLPLLVAVAVLAVAVSARINIGVRHVLPVYLALALGAGVGWQWAWRRWGSARARAALVGVTAILSAGTVTVHPDYLAYFNVLAGSDPSRLVADSDLDWGQDMLRLARAVRTHRIDTLTFAYVGTADLSPIVGAAVRFWDGTGRPSGWIAVGETVYRRGVTTFRGGEYHSRADAFFWLDSAATFQRIGKGMRLYHIPPARPSDRRLDGSRRFGRVAPGRCHELHRFGHERHAA